MVEKHSYQRRIIREDDAALAVPTIGKAPFSLSVRL
jgi:hypothetical protein